MPAADRPTMQLPSDRLAEALAFAVEVARQAGALTLDYFHTDLDPELKADGSPVTAADRAAEQCLRSLIEARFPRDAIIGEEFDEKPGATPGRWILDPIDGTVSFLSGVPIYAVLVGYEWGGRMALGVIHMPALEETVSAALGLGCSWNGEPARPSTVADLSRARLVSCGALHMERHGCGLAYQRLRDACGIERGWSDAYGYALVATGRAEIALDPVMNLWDSAALLPVLVEAGGSFTDWQGRATHPSTRTLATNGLLLEAALSKLREA
jgi:histidinol-phosphatase